MTSRRAIALYFILVLVAMTWVSWYASTAPTITRWPRRRPQGQGGQRHQRLRDRVRRAVGPRDDVRRRTSASSPSGSTSPGATRTLAARLGWLVARSSATSPIRPPCGEEHLAEVGLVARLLQAEQGVGGDGEVAEEEQGDEPAETRGEGALAPGDVEPEGEKPKRSNIVARPHGSAHTISKPSYDVDALPSRAAYWASEVIVGAVKRTNTPRSWRRARG
jgi:hypothetical protein